MGHRFDKGDAQPKSPFFQKLPPEIRRAIYKELFGGYRLHVQFSSAPFQEERAPDRTPHPHDEGNHKWLYLDVNYIFTCRKAYEESIGVLYGANTFIFRIESDWRVFIKQSFRYTGLIRSTDFFMAGYCGTDFFPAFDITSIFRGMRGSCRYESIRFVILRLRGSQPMDYMTAFSPLKTFMDYRTSHWPVGHRLRFEIFLEQAAVSLAEEKLVDLALQELGIQSDVKVTIGKIGFKKTQESPVEDSDDESYGFEYFDKSFYENLQGFGA